jgi:hypothetical protein
MHARNGTSQDNSAPGTFPPRVGPRAPENEKERESDGTSNGGDDDRAGNESSKIIASVVIDGGIAEVMHAADGAPGECSRSGDTPPTDLVTAVTRAGDDEEGHQEDEDRDKEGGDGDSDGVGDLKGWFPV